MSNIELIYDFECKKVNIIINKLLILKFNEFVNIIKENSSTILKSKNLTLNESFDFKVHFEIMFNYIINYTRHLTYSNDCDFYKIVVNDFNLYWKNIISPKLIIS